MKFEKRKIATLIRHAAKIRKSTTTDRVGKWPVEFKTRAVDLMNGGVRVKTLEKALGLHFTTLMAWRRELKTKSKGKAFRALKVVEGSRPGHQIKGPVKLFITTSQGSEIHGLTSDEVASLIKRGVL